MQEACFCGRIGEVEDRIVVDGDEERALECPDCGHLDRLEWLSDEARMRIFEDAGLRKARRGALTAA